MSWSSSSWRSVGQLGEQVGGVVGLHRLEDVGDAVVLQAGDELDLLVLGQLLEDVGELVVGEGGGDLGPALGRQVVDGLGEVGGLEVLVVLEQPGRALLVGGVAQAGDVLDGHDERLAAAAAEPRMSELRLEVRRTKTRVTDQLRAWFCSRPMSSTVASTSLALLVAHLDVALDELGEDEGLVGPLLEAAHVDQAGRDDLAAVDGGHAGHRDEDPTAARHLDDEPDDSRPASAAR